MARAAGKRQGKTTPSTAKEKTSGPNKNSSTAQDSRDSPLGSALPMPFTPAPSSLHPFLSTLPHDHVFLTHLDRTPTELKRRVFLVPCLLNLLIILGLVVRVYYAVPAYVEQISAIFGYESPYKVDVSQESTGSLMVTVFDRTFLLFTDYALFSVLGSWPREFIFGSATSRFAGPIEWRWTLGFRDVEVIARRGRKWDGSLFVQPQSPSEDVQQDQPSRRTSSRSDVAGKRTSKKGTGSERTTPWNEEEISTLLFKTAPAMTPSKLSKTGYLLLDKDYDLDFRAILDAHRLAAVAGSESESSSSASRERPRLDLDDIDGCVFVFYGSQWLMWRPNSDSNTASSSTQAPAAAPAAATDKASPTPEDAKVERFKQALIELRCLSVFYRWIEIVQFETNRQPVSAGGGGGGGDDDPEGRTVAAAGVISNEAQRRKALAELEALLEAKGVALETLLERVGGVQELPGF